MTIVALRVALLNERLSAEPEAVADFLIRKYRLERQGVVAPGEHVDAVFVPRRVVAHRGPRQTGFGAVFAGRPPVSALADFDHEMARLGAIVGTDGGALAALQERARTLGAATGFSAAEAVQGLAFLVRAGFDVRDAIDAIGGAFDPAQTRGLGPDRCTDMLSTIMESFGIDAKKAAAVAGALGRSGRRETLADSGLRISIERLLHPTEWIAGAIAALGLTAQDLDTASPSASDLVGKLAETRERVGSGVFALWAGEIFDALGRSDRTLYVEVETGGPQPTAATRDTADHRPILISAGSEKPAPGHRPEPLSPIPRFLAAAFPLPLSAAIRGRLATGTVMLVAGVLAAAAYGGWYSLSPGGGNGTSGVAAQPASAAVLTATLSGPETATVPPASAASPEPVPAAATAETPAMAPIAADGIAADGIATDSVAADAPEAVIAMAPKAPPPPPAPPDTLFMRDEPMAKAGEFEFYRTADDLIGRTSRQSVDSNGAAKR